MKDKGSRSEENLSDRAEGHQTDLAEGELETVEESIRIHERRGDLTIAPRSEKDRADKDRVKKSR